MQPKRIVLVIGSMGAGGAERQISLLANHWIGEGHRVTLVTFTAPSESFYNLDKSVSWVGLSTESEIGWASNPVQAAWRTLIRVVKLRSALKIAEPDSVVSFVSTANVVNLLATFGRKCNVVISDRTNPLMNSDGKLPNLLQKRLCRFADRVVVQTRGSGEIFRSWSGRDNVVVIPNSVAIEPEPKTQSNTVRLMAVGRLDRQKGFDLLLEALPQVPKNWTLDIWGEGDERSNLESQAEALGLSNRVSFRGLTRSIAGAFAQADVFILSSRFEGFPNVLVEAMACGVPSIAFDCDFGPRDIINYGDGILCKAGDVQSLSEAITKLVSDPALREELSERGRKAVERLRPSQAMPLWDGVI